jgi:hypothetical protein
MVDMFLGSAEASLSNNRPRDADQKYAATRVAVLIPVKRGLFRRNGLLAVDQAGTLSLANNGAVRARSASLRDEADNGAV